MKTKSEERSYRERSGFLWDLTMLNNITIAKIVYYNDGFNKKIK